YVGLPLSLEFSERGFAVVGFDVDASKVQSLARGESYIRHIPSERVASAVARGFAPTSSLPRLSECDAILLCLPTPLTEHRDPDLSYVEDTANALVPHLRRGQLIVLESTTYPGTTR